MHSVHFDCARARQDDVSHPLSFLYSLKLVKPLAAQDFVVFPVCRLAWRMYGKCGRVARGILRRICGISVSIVVNVYGEVPYPERGEVLEEVCALRGVDVV